MRVSITASSGTGTGTVRGYGAKGASASAFPQLAPGGVISGLTPGAIPEATSPTTLGDSPFTDNGTTVTLGGGRNVTVGNSVLGASGANLISTDQTTPVTPTAGTTAFYSKSGTMCSKNPAGVESCGFGGSGLIIGAPIGGSPTANAILYGDASGNLQNATNVIRSGAGQLTFGSSAGSPGSNILQGTTATDSASLGSELTTSGTCSGTGWTGTYPNYVAPGTTAPLTCTGFTSGQFYQTVTTIGAGGSGAVTIAIGTAQTASGSSGTVTAGLKANGTSLTYTPAATYTGTIGISAKLITPISTFSVTGKDSTGTVSGVVLWQTLASLHNSFSGGGGSYNTTGFNNSAQGFNALYSNTTGYSNSAQGVNALYSNTTGNYNSAQGSRPSTATPRAATTARRGSRPSTPTPRATPTAHRESTPS